MYQVKLMWKLIEKGEVCVPLIWEPKHITLLVKDYVVVSDADGKYAMENFNSAQDKFKKIEEVKEVVKPSVKPVVKKTEVKKKPPLAWAPKWVSIYNPITDKVEVSTGKSIPLDKDGKIVAPKKKGTSTKK